MSRRLSNFGLIRPKTPQDNAPKTSTPKEKTKEKLPFKRLFSFKRRKSHSNPPKFIDLSGLQDESLESTQPHSSSEPTSNKMLGSITELESRAIFIGEDESVECNFI